MSVGASLPGVLQSPFLGSKLYSPSSTTPPSCISCYNLSKTRRSPCIRAIDLDQNTVHYLAFLFCFFFFTLEFLHCNFFLLKEFYGAFCAVGCNFSWSSKCCGWDWNSGLLRIPNWQFCKHFTSTTSLWCQVMLSCCIRGVVT